jgi:hypothetical protein
MSTPSGRNKENEIMASAASSVIENFFIYMHLHEAKEMLNEVKGQLLHNNYPHLPGTVAYDNTIYFFEKLEELLNALYMLYKRH